MTTTHIMLTEQGFVAMPNNVLFAPEKQGKIRDVLFNHLVWLENDVFDGWQPTINVPYALPEGVEVEIKEVECESICDRACKEYGCDGHTKFAYLKTKEVKEES